MINRLLRACIRAYQLTLSPLLSLLDVVGGGCRYEPTCSRYCVQALREHGTLRGLWLGLKRLGRCAPWGGLGYDPVPPRQGKFTVPPAPSEERERSECFDTDGTRHGRALARAGKGIQAAPQSSDRES